MWSQWPGTSERGHHIVLPGTPDGSMTQESPPHEPHSRTLLACIQLNPAPRRAYWSSQVPDVHGHQMFMKDLSPRGDTQPSFLTAFQTRNVGASPYFPLSLCLVNHWDTGCYFLYFSQSCLFLSTSALAQALIHCQVTLTGWSAADMGPQGRVHGCNAEACLSQLYPESCAVDLSMGQRQKGLPGPSGAQDLAPLLWLSSALTGQCPVVTWFQCHLSFFFYEHILIF